MIPGLLSPRYGGIFDTAHANAGYKQEEHRFTAAANAFTWRAIVLGGNGCGPARPPRPARMAGKRLALSLLLCAKNKTLHIATGYLLIAKGNKDGHSSVVSQNLIKKVHSTHEANYLAP
jgi:hypothetical protein